MRITHIQKIAAVSIAIALIGGAAIATDRAAILWLCVILMYISIAYNLRETLIVAMYAV